ncbi:MAG: glycoside hydrolase family 20 zincin-like fold domain-containing protein [Ignavibacteriaceae bacterium]
MYKLKFSPLYLIIVLIFIVNTLNAQKLKLIPYPKEIIIKNFNFAIDHNTKILVCDYNSMNDSFAASLLYKDIFKVSGLKVKISDGDLSKVNSNAILLCRKNQSKEVDEILQRHNIHFGKDFNPEGYVIDVTKDQIIIAATTSTGIFYGIQTLKQLIIKIKSPKIIGVYIKDWPAMKIRGVMNDISHSTVTKPEYIKHQIKLCSEYKINMFMLYFEQTFDYNSLPLIAPPDGSLTVKDIKELVTYSQKYHVELVPLQESFGHFHDILKYEVYQNIAEIPYGNVITPVKDSSYALLKKMYSEIVPLFPSKYFNIGCDETLELGNGQSSIECKKEGIGKLFADHIRRLYNILKPYHKEVMFFGDIVWDYPEAIKYLPKDLIAVPWHYSADSSFDKFIQPFVKDSLRVVVAPSTRNWVGLFPDYDISMLNIRNYIRDGQKYHALGMLNTVWDSKPTLFSMNWYGILFSAAASWQEGESNIEQFKKSFDWSFYRSNDTTIASVISNLSSIHTLFRSVGLGEAYYEYFWTNPFTKDGADFVKKALPIARQVRILAEKSYEQIELNLSKIKQNKYSLDYLLFASQRLDYLGMLIEYAYQINLRYSNVYQHPHSSKIFDEPFISLGEDHGLIDDFIDALSWMKRDYIKLWDEENFPYRLDRQLVQYNLDMEFWEKKREEFLDLANKYRSGEVLPCPESIGLFIQK